ncbi:MAG: DoxX family protein [Pseudomonadota bacterium]
MEATIAQGQRAVFLVGRSLLALYFLVFGVQKIFAWDQMSGYMASHDVPLIPVLLVLTILIQVGAGASLLVGYRTQLSAFLLAGLTLMISLFMHDFWNMEESVQQGHETQNFVKNMGIMAGLMFAAGQNPGQQAQQQ